MDEDNNSNDETTKKPQNLKRSWVWNHFEEDGGEAIRQVIVKPGRICRMRLRRNKSQSTKNLHGHLLTIHNLADANLTKKTKASNHMDLDKWVKTSELRPKVQLNNNSLKTALVYFLAECDLSFLVVERKTFRKLVQLLNEGAVPLMNHTTQEVIAVQLSRIYLQSQETIKSDFLSKQDMICFTHDAWTAPNCTAFMAVTAHFIDESFQMKDLTLAVPHVQGAHTGKMFANCFYDVLKKYNAIKKLHTITADNASTNNKMERELGLKISSFKTSTHLLGCVAHVINLAAKAGLSTLSALEKNTEGQELSIASLDKDEDVITSNPCMQLSYVTSKPNGININAKTILKQVQGLTTYV
ncbi:hypothetical protein PCANC_05938 [Puccinia coronata f. sp. avenae]|uniref:HAT C-terminal dimerisation domain-containing protein n=1 Tax=Puccinia coronata f. sp. avenae TaxID=200324 RepID=A0A2N5VY45_9BASI|nr:hypothetical protein PCANC_05938 [Puccinia coronata f. sp. avenae]